MKKFLTLILLFTLTSFTWVSAQMKDPVHFETSFNKISNTEGELIFIATIDAGWHVYSTDLGSTGPTEAAFHLEKNAGIELLGQLKAEGKEIEQFDNAFQAVLRYYEKSVKFIQKVKITNPEYYIEGYLE